jgi:hypothetical protein
MDYINEAYEREQSDVKYRFVIDMALWRNKGFWLYWL